MIIIEKKKPAKKSLKKDLDKTSKKINHFLVPKHTKLSEANKNKLLQKYNISFEELPRISRKDPAISHLDLGADEIIKIIRPSPTTKESAYYRRVG